MSNAFKFTFFGGIKIGVELVYENNQKLVEFSVEDSGIGISEDDQKKLFRLFGMLDRTTKVS
jgi:signal transduction histidine kinase